MIVKSHKGTPGDPGAGVRGDCKLTSGFRPLAGAVSVLICWTTPASTSGSVIPKRTNIGSGVQIFCPTNKTQM